MKNSKIESNVGTFRYVLNKGVGNTKYGDLDLALPCNYDLCVI